MHDLILMTIQFGLNHFLLNWVSLFCFIFKFVGLFVIFKIESFASEKIHFYSFQNSTCSDCVFKREASTNPVKAYNVLVMFN